MVYEFNRAGKEHGIFAELRPRTQIEQLLLNHLHPDEIIETTTFHWASILFDRPDRTKTVIAARMKKHHPFGRLYKMVKSATILCR